MATIDILSKAPVLVETANGDSLNRYECTVTSDPEGIVSHGFDADDNHTIAGETEGVTTLSVTSAFGVGSLEVTVTAAPLSVSLGAAVPK